MKIRVFQIFMINFIIALLCGTFIASASDKKGIGIADLKASDKISILNVKWYYTWKPYPVDNVKDVEFVPMIWGGKRTREHITAIKQYGKVKYLLFLNEPDKEDQANMSVDEAIEILKEIQNFAEEISTPACAGGMNKWCDTFLRKVKDLNLKISFIALHFYVPPDSEKFLKKIDNIYRKYKMPIWITEFAVADWEAKRLNLKNRYSEEMVLNFLKRVLPELEKREYVKRYAWFGAGKDCYRKEHLKTSCLFDEHSNLTVIGIYYSNFKNSLLNSNRN